MSKNSEPTCEVCGTTEGYGYCHNPLTGDHIAMTCWECRSAIHYVLTFSEELKRAQIFLDKLTLKKSRKLRAKVKEKIQAQQNN